MRLTAQPVAYSSVVGQSIMLLDEEGRCVALLAVRPMVDELAGKDAVTVLAYQISAALNNTNLTAGKED